MSKFTYLFTAEDQNGAVSTFQADGAFTARPGDLILCDGELFTIRKANCCDIYGDDYAMISDIADIRHAEMIFSPIWHKEEPDDANDP
jgi:hypothetical protein